MPIDCIIPAAGASSRMGAFKPLLSFGRSTVVETTVSSAMAAGLRVILVLGYRGGEIADRFASLAAGPGLVLVENPRWEEGMMASLQAGLALVQGDFFSTIPADMPLVEPGVHLALLGAWEAGLSRGLLPVPLFAAHEGQVGHPVLIPVSLIPGLLALPPGAKARPFLLAQGGRPVECGSPSVLSDLDTNADYRAARRAHGLD